MKKLIMFMALVFGFSAQASTITCDVIENYPDAPTFVFELDQSGSFARVIRKSKVGGEELLLEQATVLVSNSTVQDVTKIQGKAPDEPIDWSQEKQCWAFGSPVYDFTISNEVNAESGTQKGSFQKSPTIEINPAVKGCEPPNLMLPLPQAMICVKK